MVYIHTENDKKSKEEAFWVLQDWVLKTKCITYDKTLNLTVELIKKFYKNPFITHYQKNEINYIYHKYLINDGKIAKDYSKIIDEKIKKYENICNPNNMEENKNLIDKELLIKNNILEEKNSELRQVIKDILANDIYSTPVINSKIKEKLINILNDTQQTSNISTNFCSYEDLIMMLNAQCYLNEIQMNNNNI